MQDATLYGFSLACVMQMLSFTSTTS